jgi:hypothetical protein
MRIFRPSGDAKAVTAWGPTAATGVTVNALDSASVEKDWILTGVQVNSQEITDVRQCFSDVSYIYALGNDQGRCRIDLYFLVFVGTKNCKGMDNFVAIENGLGAYAGTRISNNTMPMTISIGGFSAQAWLIGISVGQMDASRCVCRGEASFILKLPQR